MKKLLFLFPLITGCLASKNHRGLHPVTQKLCVDGLYVLMESEGCTETYQADIAGAPVTKFRCTKSKTESVVTQSVFLSVPPGVATDDPNYHLICSDPTGNVYIQLNP